MSSSRGCVSRDRGCQARQVDEHGPAVNDSGWAVDEVFVLVEQAGFDDLQIPAVDLRQVDGAWLLDGQSAVDPAAVETLLLDQALESPQHAALQTGERGIWAAERQVDVQPRPKTPVAQVARMSSSSVR
ncbi:hypothetical protein [Sinorhizobium fredii]|nr:hypothetical protein [Sinorhizobium fredii]MQW99617.1 hypothetical protein [Sinorhizobium fredii]